MERRCASCGAPIYSIVGLHFDPKVRIVQRDGYTAEVRLSPSCGMLFALFLREPGHVVSRAAMENAVYGLKPDCDYPDTNSLAVMLSRMCGQLKPLDLEFFSVWGIGWILRDSSLA